MSGECDEEGTRRIDDSPRLGQSWLGCRMYVCSFSTTIFRVESSFLFLFFSLSLSLLTEEPRRRKISRSVPPAGGLIEMYGRRLSEMRSYASSHGPRGSSRRIVSHLPRSPLFQPIIPNYASSISDRTGQFLLVRVI